MIKSALLVFMAGGAGSAARYLLHAGTLKWLPFPVGTLLINVAGSLLIGVVYALAERQAIGAEVRTMLAAGLCGGFTTFSAFSYENMVLLKNGQIAGFVLYAATSVLLCVGAVWAGAMMAK